MGHIPAEHAAACRGCLWARSMLLEAGWSQHREIFKFTRVASFNRQMFATDAPHDRHPLIIHHAGTYLAADQVIKFHVHSIHYSWLLLVLLFLNKLVKTCCLNFFSAPPMLFSPPSHSSQPISSTTLLPSERYQYYPQSTP